jgi:transcriptional regulator with XRE-family HTH domain
LTELKAIIAENIAILRKSKMMTQSDLAIKLNYSDKAVSKWERGESVPDIVVLKSIADLFGVTVDYLLTRDHKVYKEERKAVKKRKKNNQIFITLMGIVAVWLVAVVIFLNFNSFLSELNGKWLVFIYAVFVSSVVGIILTAFGESVFIT